MLELKHICKTYKTSKGVETQALKDINLSFPKQGLVFVLGKSGSGKSTLLNVVGGLDQANSGEIIINGKSSSTFSKADYDSYRNTYIGFIFQEFNLMDDYTIAKNIALALQLQQKDDNPDKIDALLTRLGLEGYANRYPNELSGGQKQRVAIARALIKEPEILMADEPTGALDSTTGKEIFETLKELSKEKLVIVVSHDQDSAHRYADRIIEFKDGEIALDSAPEVERSNEEFHAIRSHLPFKHSFKLGFSCLGHKKIRMVFTILLTSFALLTLALSDAVGNFDGAKAQNKAMQDNGEYLAGIRYQQVGKDGTVYRNYFGNGMNPIKEKDAANIVNDNNLKLARVYETHSMPKDIVSMGIGSLDLDLYDQEVQSYYLTEMNSFDDLKLKDVVGTYPSNYDQVAISSYLADIIIKNGVYDKDGTIQRPKDYQEIIANTKLKIANKELKVSGITKKDLSAFDSLKGMQREQINDESYKTLRMFSSVVNKDCDKLFVKDGFVEQLKLPENNQLVPNMGSIQLESNSNIAGVGSLAYPIEAITYYDGTRDQSVDTLEKNEVVLSVSDAYNLFGNSNSLYDGTFMSKSEADRKDELQKIAKQIVGKTISLKYQEYYGSDSYLIDEKVKIAGVSIPENITEDILYGGMTYTSETLVKPYISNVYFIGELLTNLDGVDALDFLSKYDINSAYFADTIATADVVNVEDFANFATKVFLIASVAFFFFAAMLMMNFIVVSISYRKKDIGILRAIGARSTDVLKIFVWEGITLACIAYVITFIGLEAIAFVVNNFAIEQIGIMISPVILTLRQPILLFIIVTIVTALACALPVTKIARQRPIDAIKK